ncbi:hypothetical protein AcW1_004538 [Taiwanofungus camphoratus]|nr:hypothetical protein AcW1_004538 [Antrodia cinnamomea]
MPLYLSGKNITVEERAPAYSEEKSLQAATAVQNKRYDKDVRVHPQYINIKPGLHSRMCLPNPPYLPEGWTQHWNPEGTCFYVKDLESLHVVTDIALQNPNFSEKLLTLIENIQLAIKTLGIILPKDIELYINLNDDNCGCSYYLIDHSSRTEFWLEEVDSYSLGIPQVASIEHLKFVLQEHYWTHVEYFPYRPIANEVREELVDILRHARADQLTSDTSTFPYDADQCAKFIELINVNTACTTYMTCVIARIWVTISRHRFDNYYGEDSARLGRDQRRLELPLVESSIIVTFCSSLLFGFPKAVKAEMELLFIHNLLYTMHWRKFASAAISNWQESSLLSAGLLVANAGFLVISRGFISTSTGLASTILSTSALLSGVTLLQWYSGAVDMNAVTVADHMARIQHPKLGFAPVALIYSFPRALMFWSMLLLVIHMLVLVTEMPGKLFKLSIGIIIALIGIAFIKMNHILKGAFTLSI